MHEIVIQNLSTKAFEKHISEDLCLKFPPISISCDGVGSKVSLFTDLSIIVTFDVQKYSVLV